MPSTTMHYQSLDIFGDSAFTLSSAGQNAVNGQKGLVNADDGSVVDGTNYTAFVTIVVKATQAVVLATTAVPPVAGTPLYPVRFAYRVPAGTCTTGSGPWTAAVEVRGPGGLGDTLDETWYYDLTERSGKR